MGAIVTHWDPEELAGFGRRLIGFRHTLHERPMFSDEGLASILDRYPREALGVFTMGEDLEDWRSWRRGSAGRMSGDLLLAAVKAGRLWLNLRHANEHLGDFAALCDEISAEKEKAFRTRVLSRDLGLLISSPNARVFYHLDVPLSSLWQVRGEKRIWLYPRDQPYVQADWLERCVHGTAEGQMPFMPAWDAIAESRALGPGDMITWAQNAPHRVDNGPMMNVSVSMEYMTPRARVRANVLHANGLLRTCLGWTPRIQAGPGPVMAAKLMLAAAHKAAIAHRVRAPVLEETFSIGGETVPAN
jgi:hypothetical protein